MTYWQPNDIEAASLATSACVPSIARKLDAFLQQSMPVINKLQRHQETLTGNVAEDPFSWTAL